MVRSVVGRSNAWVRAVVALMALALFAPAQQARAQNTATPATPRRTALSTNPLGFPLELISAEIESRANALVTLGVSLSYFSPSDESYISAEGKLRLYPNEEALRGFSVGLGLGFARLSEDLQFVGPGGTDERESTTRPTIAALVDYNWHLGRSKRVLVGTGLGVKRILGDSDVFSDVLFIYPTARFQIGVLF